MLAGVNILAHDREKKWEIIFGSCYGAAAILTVLSEDLISVFVGIELMMIFATILILIGGQNIARHLLRNISSLIYSVVI